MLIKCVLCYIKRYKWQAWPWLSTFTIVIKKHSLRKNRWRKITQMSTNGEDLWSYICYAYGHQSLLVAGDDSLFCLSPSPHEFLLQQWFSNTSRSNHIHCWHLWTTAHKWRYGRWLKISVQSIITHVSGFFLNLRCHPLFDKFYLRPWKQQCKLAMHDTNPFDKNSSHTWRWNKTSVCQILVQQAKS